MLSYYYRTEKALEEILEPKKGTWISLVAPEEAELAEVEALGIDSNMLRAALDAEETSHIDIDDGQTLIIIDVPIVEESDDRKGSVYSTLPVGIIITEDYIVTVSLKETSTFADLKAGRIRNVTPVQKTKFVLQILLRVANRYLFYLKQIDKLSHEGEKQLHKSMKNKELFQLLDLEKSLVYFSTSLQSNSITIKKILSGRVLKLYEEDQDLLDDVLIELNQAIEMSNIYSSILSGTMDAFASVISNNLNIVMKVLTSVTILLTIPNVVFSFYGMNVGTTLPIPTSWFATGIAALLTLAAWILLKKNDLI